MDHWSSRNTLVSFLRYAILAVILIAGGLYAYTWKVLKHDSLNVPVGGYDLNIEQGTTLNQFTKQLHTSGLLSKPLLLRGYLIYKGNVKQIKAGEYHVEPGMSAIKLLDKVFAGAVTQYSFTVVEGWQTAQVIAALHQHPKITPLLAGLSQQEIIKQLDIPVQHLEGVFLPDTYFFSGKTTDVEFLRRAYIAMQAKLMQAWEQRDPQCILTNPYQALILASIIEKETNIKSEYAQISGVFTRRLQQGMKLQADPTVIYGLQDKLAGPLLRRHLAINTPYNTYQNLGLPPTPIALPSLGAIEAALHPADGENIYFVATGDGGHIFTATLTEHNKAVQQLYSSRN